MRVSLYSGSVFLTRHGWQFVLCISCALFCCADRAESMSAQKYAEIASVELTRKPLMITLGLKGSSVSVTSKTPEKSNRVEISLQGARISPKLTDSFELPSGPLRKLTLKQEHDVAKVIADFGSRRPPQFTINKRADNIVVTFSLTQEDSKPFQVDSRKPDLHETHALLNSKKPNTSKIRSRSLLDSQDAKYKKLGRSSDNTAGIPFREGDQDDQSKRGKSDWKTPAGKSANCSSRQLSDHEYSGQMDRPFGLKRIGRAECIDIESEYVCFFYEEVFLRYANPKDVIKTIDCMFNMHCPGTGQGGQGGGTEHVATRFTEHNMSPRTVIRDGRDKAKTLKPTDDRGFDRIEELRLMPLPEFPRRPYETGVDTKSWRMLRDIDRKDPKLSKILAHSMVWADEQKRVVFLKDTEKRLSQIRKVINSLDRPSLQVLIQSRIVRANKDWSRGLGILWGGRNNQVGMVRDSANAYWGFGGNQEGYSAGTTGPSNRATGLTTSGVNIPSTFAVNLPVAVTNLSNLMGLGVQFGLLKPNYITELDFRLQLGESSGNAKVVARPEIQVMDGERAIIKNGSVMTLKTSSPNWGTHTELVPVDLKLEVTPKTLFNNRIRMDVDIFDNDVDGRTVCGNCEIVRLFFTREAHTTLVVGDGETCVLGGIIREGESSLKQGWPLLMKIPVVGRLFSSVSKATKSDELLVFLTPSIVRPENQNVSASEYGCMKSE